MMTCQHILSLRTFGLLLDRRNLVLVDLEVHGDGGGLDSNTTLLLVVSGVHETHVTSLCMGNDTGLGDKRVGEGGLSVVDWWMRGSSATMEKEDILPTHHGQ
jgi:hypothetical protein